MGSDCSSATNVKSPALTAIMAKSFTRNGKNGSAHRTVFPMISERPAPSNIVEVPKPTMLHVAKLGGLQTAPDVGAVSSRVVSTSRVQVELLRCRSQGMVHWRAAGPEMFLMLVRSRTEESRITIEGSPSERIGSGRAKFWFFPDGVGAQGELWGMGPFDCASIFVDQSVLPTTVRAFLSHPVCGLAHERLRRAFDALVEELNGPEHVAAPLFAEGWALWALAHVAEASQELGPSYARPVGGLAPWQLRRATELLRAETEERRTLECIAAACRLSAPHFARSFKQSMGVPPHQWLMNARVDMARDLLLHSSLTLVQIASTCGFSDQSHFSRIFKRFEGLSPGAWRRWHQ